MGEHQKSEVYSGSHGIKGKRFRGNVIKVIQGHEINVKIELSGSLCVKPHQ